MRLCSVSYCKSKVGGENRTPSLRGLLADLGVVTELIETMSTVRNYTATATVSCPVEGDVLYFIRSCVPVWQFDGLSFSSGVIRGKSLNIAIYQNLKKEKDHEDFSVCSLKD